MRVIITGGRTSTDRALVAELLARLRGDAPDLVVIVGYDQDDERYQGVDQMVFEECLRVGIPVAPFPAPWRRYGRRAGPLRNSRMLHQAKPHEVRALPGGPGTANMMTQADRAGVPVKVWGWTDDMISRALRAGVRVQRYEPHRESRA